MGDLLTPAELDLALDLGDLDLVSKIPLVRVVSNNNANVILHRNRMCGPYFPIYICENG